MYLVLKGDCCTLYYRPFDLIINPPPPPTHHLSVAMPALLSLRRSPFDQIVHPNPLHLWVRGGDSGCCFGVKRKRGVGEGVQADSGIDVAEVGFKA